MITRDRRGTLMHMSERSRFDPGRMKGRPAARTPGLFGAASATGSRDGTAPMGSGGSGVGDSQPPASTTAPSVTLGPERRLTVSQLAAIIERALRDALPTGLKVVGEISQFRERTHWYFDLKDADALVSCVMFASAARKAGFMPEPGQQVLVTGRVDFYAKQGRTTFMVDRIEPIGVGALELAFKRLCDELRGLGYFDDERKRPLPMLPRRVGVVTSRTGAALQDVLDTLSRRCPAIEVAILDTRVQGDGAAAEIARTIRAAGRAHRTLGLDVLLVTRGGGSREDLWCFNERVVADAILHAEIPVVAAIGHETDTTIAELVADVRGATPTQAAMRIAPDSAALLRQLDAHAARLRTHAVRQIKLDASRLAELRAGLKSASRSALSHAHARWSGAVNALERHRPVAVYAQREANLRRVAGLLASTAAARVRQIDLASVEARLQEAMRRRLARSDERTATLERGLELVGPVSVMSRGYSVTLNAQGKAVRSVADVSTGDTIITRVIDGGFASVVGEQAAGRGSTGQAVPALPAVAPEHVRLAAQARRARRRADRDDSGPGLFPAD